MVGNDTLAIRCDRRYYAPPGLGALATRLQHAIAGVADDAAITPAITRPLSALRLRRVDPAEPAAVLLVPGVTDQAEWIRRAEIRNRFAMRPEMEPPPRPTDAPEPPPSTPVRSGARGAAPAIPRRTPPRLMR